jgi:cytochrome c-type biogenesis protein CcmH/NrfG
MDRIKEIRARAELALAYIDERQNPEAWAFLGAILAIADEREPTEDAIERALDAACAQLAMPRYTAPPA